ncbi:alpha/beta fold hydrolase [Oharaeibacter diazotrophicus]|uniref:Alpha-beta hydrolase superfamily lysophospholipase n=1 Tax=Oharaeibacter diazotrophicus TaxID=1920512 RepID=A0A4R6R8I0_9HYPH|nr:alpha/beta fold hydrolase [Oharaeibacter diazotrophicus]TDP81887.1 alpha-beta hydrolase superfamily lysophospholipase [Oharaeibacter diazotrophicus]BBE73519.1 lipase 3 precursor [Pleomorphomonas sp. SM30]GLS75308.1 alpha/beta hydrolase [Oharaeibacter diazotrophicus]
MTVRPFARDGLRLDLHDRGDGPALVLQHGLCGSAAAIADVADRLAGHRVLTLDCRGHGGSESGEASAFSIATFAGDVAAVIEAERLGPVALGGVSMGAAIATRLAVRRPALVRALVLVRPAWVADPNPANLSANVLVGDLLAAHPPAEARRLFEASDAARTLAAEAPDNLASLLGFFAREPIATTAALLTRISADGPGIPREDLAALAVPTLVIGTTRDAIHPMATAEALAAAIPGARLIVVHPKADDRARHAAEVAAAIADFLAALPGSATR